VKHYLSLGIFLVLFYMYLIWFFSELFKALKI
jgi:hypothetical protein